MRYCDRCGKPIKPGQPYRETIPDSMSGARPTAYYHRELCQRPPTQAVLIPRSY
jgi:hypothetical protein